MEAGRMELGGGGLMTMRRGNELRWGETLVVQ